MSMAGGQAQTDAVNDANGVRTECERSANGVATRPACDERRQGGVRHQPRLTPTAQIHSTVESVCKAQRK